MHAFLLIFHSHQVANKNRQIKKTKKRQLPNPQPQNLIHSSFKNSQRQITNLSSIPDGGGAAITFTSLITRRVVVRHFPFVCMFMTLKLARGKNGYGKNSLVSLLLLVMKSNSNPIVISSQMLVKPPKLYLLSTLFLPLPKQFFRIRQMSVLKAIFQRNERHMVQKYQHRQQHYPKN